MRNYFAQEMGRKRRSVAKRRETLANPAHRIKRANGETRYLSKAQAAQHPSHWDRAGNPTGVT